MRVNKTNFHMKVFALETEAKGNSEIAYWSTRSNLIYVSTIVWLTLAILGGDYGIMDH